MAVSKVLDTQVRRPEFKPQDRSLGGEGRMVLRICNPNAIGQKQTDPWHSVASQPSGWALGQQETLPQKTIWASEGTQ